MELIVFSMFIALIVASVIWRILSFALTKAPSFEKVYACACLIVFVLLTLAMLFPQHRSPPPAPASNIISNLRSIQAAAMSFYEDNRDNLTEIPRDSNIVEYLQQYMDWPRVSNNYGPDIFIISGDYWWVGRNLGQTHEGRSREVRRRLAARASSVGLFGTSEFTPPISADEAYRYNMDDFVWMFVPVGGD